jgi:hypothetical protein
MLQTLHQQVDPGLAPLVLGQAPVIPGRAPEVPRLAPVDPGQAPKTGAVAWCGMLQPLVLVRATHGQNGTEGQTRQRRGVAQGRGSGGITVLVQKAPGPWYPARWAPVVRNATQSSL